MSRGSMSHVILRNAHIAVSNLGVEGHNDKRGPAFPFDIYVVHNVIDGGSLIAVTDQMEMVHLMLN